MLDGRVSGAKVAKKKRKKKSRRGSGKSVSLQSKEEIYQSGLSHFREGEYELAIRAWSGIAKGAGPRLEVQLAEAYFRNAISKDRSGDTKAAISELHSALKYGDHNQPLYLFHIGLAYHHTGKLSQAISYYTRAVQAAPEVERYRYHLGLARMQNDEVQESVTLFEAIDDFQGRIGEILAHISQGDNERSLAVLKVAHKQNKGVSKFLEGLVHLTQGDNKQAKRLLKAAASGGMGNGVPDYYLGVAHVRTDTIPSAISAWENASQKGLDMGLMKDDMANIYRQLAYRYFDRGDLARVTKIWEKLLEVQPEDDETRDNLVHAYFLRANDYAETEQIIYAIRYWEKAWELDSTNTEIAHNLALAYEKRNELAKAAEYWKAAVTGWKRQMATGKSDKEVLKARMHTVHAHLADIALRTDNLGRAIVEYDQALRYAPEDVGTIVKLADLHMVDGNSNKAIQLLSRARRLSPKDTDVLQQLSYAYVMKGDLSRSMECMREILKIDPNNELYQEMVGQYYLARATDDLNANKHKSALRFLNEGLEVCPNNTELQAFAGAVYLGMGDKLEAEAVFQKIIAVDPTDTGPYIIAAHHYLENDMIDDAESYFAKVIELDPDNPQLYIDIADEYCCLHICKQSRKYLEMAKKMRPGDATTLTAIVESLMGQECGEYGVPYAKELMSVAPDDPKSYFFLGLAYYFDDMEDEAMDTLLEGLEIAEETENDEMIDEIEGLYSHIEFGGSPFGNLWDEELAELMNEFRNILE